MTIKKIASAVIFFMAAISAREPGWAQAGKPVMYLSVSLLQENNIIKVSWEPQEGAAEYTVEKWEINGTGHWHFDINDRVKPGDSIIRIGGAELNPLKLAHRANPGKAVEFYDQDVKPGHTYFYRVNGGIIGAVETLKRPVVPLSEGQDREIRDRQAGEQAEMDREKAGKAGSGQSERQKAYEKSADYPERLAADLVMALPNWLIEVIGLHDPLELVFEVDLKDSYRLEDGPPDGKSDLIWNIYKREEFEVIGDFYTDAEQAMPVFMAVGVVAAGVLMLFNSASPQAVVTARGYILGILLAALLIKLGPYLIGFFFDVNRAVVALCHSVAADEIHQSFLHTVYNRETRSLGAALMALIGCLSIGVINFQFTMRKVCIAILVGILPIALVNAIFPGRRNALAVWVREFSSYVFMPAGLAVGLVFFIHFLNSGGFWVTLVCLLSLPTINSLVRGALGLSDSGLTAGIGSALGMGAIFSLGGMLGGGRDGKDSPKSGGAGATQAMGGTGAAQPGTGSGPAAGERGPGVVLGKGAPGIAGYLAKGAAAGSMALAGGIISGAVSGDVHHGLEYGIKAGRGAAASFGSVAFSMERFFPEVREKGLAGATGITDGSMLMDPGVTASLAARALGGNAVGNTVAAAAATASRAARAISPLVAPQARERLDMVTSLAGMRPGDGGEPPSETSRTPDIGREFEKARQMQHFRSMFEKIKNSRHTGGTGGINGFTWR